jgi:hypothetical protein
MEWINGLTSEARRALKERWHKWFAWYPITIEINNESHKVKLWLEYVERL